VSTARAMKNQNASILEDGRRAGIVEGERIAIREVFAYLGKRLPKDLTELALAKADCEAGKQKLP
jgi:hypothetical protein